MEKNVKVIDVHVHITPLNLVKEDVRKVWTSDKFYNENLYNSLVNNPSKLVELLDEWNVEWINLISYVAKEVMGFGYEFVDFVGKYSLEYPDKLRPMMSVDPNDVRAIERLEEFRSKYNCKWIKIHPVHSLFKPNSYRPEEGGVKILQRIYEYAEENKFPVTIHTGTSIFPRARIKYGDPLYIDDIANDFPRLKVVIAHGGRPITAWANTTFFLLRRHKNVYLDISGIPPKNLLNYFPRIEDVADKVMFGSDWYTLGVENIKKNVEMLLETGLNKEVISKILYENASKII
jgi:predicted TIM-barrel fold metal-dependent hydrolase